MGKSKDYSGKKFGRLLMLEKTNIRKGVDVLYKCQCDCGKICYIRSSNIVSGHTKSCGCLLKRGITKNRYEFDEKYAYIYVTNREKPAIIDIEDYEKVEKYHWTKTTRDYTVSHIDVNGKLKKIYLHRLIMGVEDKKTKLNVDHINGNVLDNRKINLRFATQLQNCWNKRLNSNNTLGVAGVREIRNAKIWNARIIVNYKVIHLGNYRDINEAIKARKEAEIKYFGEYRRKDDIQEND